MHRSAKPQTGRCALPLRRERYVGGKSIRGLRHGNHYSDNEPDKDLRQKPRDQRRKHPREQGGHLRIPRTQRRGKIDHDPDSSRLHKADQRERDHFWPGLPEGHGHDQEAHRVHPGRLRPVRQHDRLEVPRVLREGPRGIRRRVREALCSEDWKSSSTAR